VDTIEAVAAARQPPIDNVEAVVAARQPERAALFEGAAASE
jgi:hypothetical protein